MDILVGIGARLEQQGFSVALNHLRQAESALERHEWEAANAQVRSCLEALFNDVARIRLRTAKTGGAARKQLEDEGLLSPRDAALVKAFMDAAGGAGSHAGTSNEDESHGRYLAGIGISYLALALVPELTRVEDIIAAELTAPEGRRLATDAEIRTECPTCGQRQFLSEAEVRRDGQETVYHCRNGCQPIVVVGLPGDSPWPGRGYRMGDFVVRNAKDVIIPVNASEPSPLNPPQILIPASPAALMKRPPGASA